MSWITEAYDDADEFASDLTEAQLRAERAISDARPVEDDTRAGGTDRPVLSAASAPVITERDVLVIEYRDHGPDSQGRRSFVAYWLAEDIGPSCDETGVRGQAFRAVPGEFIAEAMSQGREVRS